MKAKQEPTKMVRYDKTRKLRRTNYANEDQKTLLAVEPRRQAVVETPTYYVRAHHAAVRTTSYIFNQLIPYIGNKRKLLPLIQQALHHTGPVTGDFVDLFAGSGVVSRFAKQLGYRVICNDWEHYAYAINRCYITCNEPPPFRTLGGYEKTLATLNGLPPKVGWITEHLCPRDDQYADPDRERMFYMRKNGMRIDAIRDQIAEWKATCMISGSIDDLKHLAVVFNEVSHFEFGFELQFGTLLRFFELVGDSKHLWRPTVPFVFRMGHQEVHENAKANGCDRVHLTIVVIDKDDHDVPVAFRKLKVFPNVEPLVVVLLLDFHQVTSLAIVDFVVIQRRRHALGGWEQNTAKVSLFTATPSNGKLFDMGQDEKPGRDDDWIGFHNRIPFLGLGLSEKFYHGEIRKYASYFSRN